MLKWKLEDGLIKELTLENGENLIFPWGVETADEWSFFSLERSVGYRYERTHEKIEGFENKQQVELDVQMCQGEFRLSIYDELKLDQVLREVSLETLKETRLMDFVMRFRFKKEFFPRAHIVGQSFEHKNTNIYHQYVTSEASLSGPLGKIKIEVLDAYVPQTMTQHLYVRDRGDEWIIHVRMLPHSWDRETIKLCNSFFKTRPLPQFFSRLILSFDSLRSALWYRGERSPYIGKFLRWLNPNAFPMCSFPKGEKLSFKVQMSWSKI